MYIHIPNWAENESLTLFIQKNTFQLHYKSGRRRCWLVLLSKLVDGLCQAVEPGVAGDQHQEDHGDHLHCAGEGEILAQYEEKKEARISPPGAQPPLLRDSQLPPLALLHALLLQRLLHWGLRLGQALLGSVCLRGHLLQVHWQRSNACVVAMLVQARLCYFSSCTWTVFVTQIALYFSSDNPHFIHTCI